MIIMSPLTLLFDVLERLSSSALPLPGIFSSSQTIFVSFLHPPRYFHLPPRAAATESGHPPSSILPDDAVQSETRSPGLIWTPPATPGCPPQAAPHRRALAPAALPALQAQPRSTGAQTCCTLCVMIFPFIEAAHLGRQHSRSFLLLRPSPAALGTLRGWGRGPRSKLL